MKRLAVAMAAFVLGAGPADAAVIATDFFNDPSYSLGGNIYPDSDQNIGYGYGVGPNEGTGFSTGWQNPFYTSPRVVASPLSYPGLATFGYGAAGPAYVACVYCANSTAIRTFSDNAATTDLWVSFLIEDDDVTADDFTAYPAYGGLAVEDAVGDDIYTGVPGVQPISTADYSLQTNNDVDESATAAAPGTTVLLVVDISDDGKAYLYVDPTVGQALGAPAATIAAPFTPSAATELYWSDSWGWTYGDVRVGTTLADVTPAPAPVPEPPAWATLLVGAAGLGARLRRRPPTEAPIRAQVGWRRPYARGRSRRPRAGVPVIPGVAVS
jgi:hypothetical protein